MSNVNGNDCAPPPARRREPPATPLRKRRKAKGLALEHLAALTGGKVSVSTIRLAERAPSTMSDRTAVLLARALGCEPADLVVR